MTEAKQRAIFKLRRDIGDNKRNGYTYIPKQIEGKQVAYIVNPRLKVNFYIDDENLKDIYNCYLESGMVKYIPFLDWILQTEIV